MSSKSEIIKVVKIHIRFFNKLSKFENLLMTIGDFCLEKRSAQNLVITTISIFVSSILFLHLFPILDISNGKVSPSNQKN